jgi:hypothetical protein
MIPDFLVKLTNLCINGIITHDEYTTIIEQKELKEKLKLEKKERLLTRIKRILKIAVVVLSLLLIFGVLFFVILTILK